MERITALGAEEGADDRLVRALMANVEVEVLKGLEGPLHTIVHRAVEVAVAKATQLERREIAGPEPKNRDEVWVPKKGSLFASMWEKLDNLQKESGKTPTLEDILNVGKKESWNPHTTRTKYYHWRRSHGITGRLAA